MSDQEKKVSACTPVTEREAVNFGRGGFYAPEGTPQHLAEMQNRAATTYYEVKRGNPDSLCPEVTEEEMRERVLRPHAGYGNNVCSTEGMATEEVIKSWTKAPDVIVSGLENIDPALLVLRPGGIGLAVPNTGLSITAEAISQKDAEQGYSWPVRVSVNHDATQDMAAGAELDLSNIVPNGADEVEEEESDTFQMGLGVPAFAQQILNDMGMSAKELIENSSVNDGAVNPPPEPVEAKPDDAIPEENLRYTSVPIPTELIREYFTNKGIFYVVDYQKSRLKGSNFLTYLTNLAVPSDVNFGEVMQYEEYSEVMKAYLDQRSVVSCSLLHVMAAELLLFAKGLSYEALPYVTPVPKASFLIRFIDENKDQISRWLHFIDSTQVFALSAIKRLNSHYKPKEVFENIDDKEYVGSNVAQLYRIPEFIAYYFSIDGAQYQLSYFTQQYEEYMFKNERLAKYFRSPNNFAALMFEHIAVGTFKASDIGYGMFGIGVFDPAKGIAEYDHTAPASED